MSVSEQLRKACETSGLTRYRIAKDSGVSYDALARFLNEERDLRLATADKLADYFGLVLKPKRAKRRK